MRDGGLRFGEMERDCVIAHGASLLLRERTFESADQYYIPVHADCGLISIRKTNGDYYCSRCQKKDKESFGKKHHFTASFFHTFSNIFFSFYVI